MTTESHVEEMRLAATIAASKNMIGFCAGGFPLTGGEACRFCGATWQDECGRKDRNAALTSGDRGK
jgi:hypothetical protein